MEWLNIPFIERQGSERTMSKPIRSAQQQILVTSGQIEEKLKDQHILLRGTRLTASLLGGLVTTEYPAEKNLIV